jgi:hypothetical protein
LINDNLPLAENRPIDVLENRPSKQLVHSYGRGKRIPDRELQELALKKYEINGRGITFTDVINKFGCSKPKAQRKLKNAYIKKGDKKGKKGTILFTLDNERTIPQQYFPSCIRARIIENKRNRLIDPTGVSLYQSPYLEKLKARSVMELLSLLQNQPISIHKPSFKLDMHKNYYNDIDVAKITKGNKSKSHEEMIGQRNVKYEVYPCGTIMIYIACSNKPFKLEVEEDVSSFFAFLGQVKDRLIDLLSDFSERAIPQVMDWILIQCDINQDVGINIVEQLSLPDLQLRVYDRIFRLYVKNIDGSSYYRIEESKQINQAVRFAIPEIMKLSNSHVYNPSKYNYIQ